MFSSSSLKCHFTAKGPTRAGSEPDPEQVGQTVSSQPENVEEAPSQQKGGNISPSKVAQQMSIPAEGPEIIIFANGTVR